MKLIVDKVTKEDVYRVFNKYLRINSCDCECVPEKILILRIPVKSNQSVCGAKMADDPHYHGFAIWKGPKTILTGLKDHPLNLQRLPWYHNIYVLQLKKTD